MAIEAVVFDMDGVLFDTERLCLRAWIEVAERHGIEGIEQVFPLCIGRTTPDTKEIIQQHYGELDIDGLYEVIRAVIKRYIAEEGIPTLPYAEETLSQLKAAGVPLAIGSSTRFETVCAQLKMAGLFGYFDQIVGGDLVQNGKPAPDIYLKACELLGVEPSRAAAVEDSFNGIRAAKAAGMTAIMVPDMVEPDEEMRGLADCICDDLRGAAAFVKEHLF